MQQTSPLCNFSVGQLTRTRKGWKSGRVGKGLGRVSVSTSAATATATTVKHRREPCGRRPIRNVRARPSLNLDTTLPVLDYYNTRYCAASASPSKPTKNSPPSRARIIIFYITAPHRRRRQRRIRNGRAITCRRVRLLLW